MGNIVRARVTIRGTRPLLQHEFGPDAIPLEAQERTGVAGNDPQEWRKTCMVTPDGQMFVRGTNLFSMIRDGAKYTKKGRASMQGYVAATLQVEEDIVLLNRKMPEQGDPPMKGGADVYIDVRSVRNPTTKGRNVRYRLSASSGWECTFTILWDRTVVSREQMKAALRDASVLVGLGDGRTVGCGRFGVVSFEELTDAEEAPAAGSVESTPADRVGAGRKKVRPVPAAATVDGVPH